MAGKDGVCLRRWAVEFEPAGSAIYYLRTPDGQKDIEAAFMETRQHLVDENAEKHRGDWINQNPTLGGALFLIVLISLYALYRGPTGVFFPCFSRARTGDARVPSPVSRSRRKNAEERRRRQSVLWHADMPPNPVAPTHPAVTKTAEEKRRLAHKKGWSWDCGSKLTKPPSASLKSPSEVSLASNSVPPLPPPVVHWAPGPASTSTHSASSGSPLLRAPTHGTFRPGPPLACGEQGRRPSPAPTSSSFGHTPSQVFSPAYPHPHGVLDMQFQTPWTPSYGQSGPPYASMAAPRSMPAAGSYTAPRQDTAPAMYRGVPLDLSAPVPPVQPQRRDTGEVGYGQLSMPRHSRCIAFVHSRSASASPADAWSGHKGDYGRDKYFGGSQAPIGSAM